MSTLIKYFSRGSSVPVFKPNLTPRDIATVFYALITNQISGTSSMVSKFEGKMSRFSERKFGIAVSNGSVALDLAFEVLGLCKDDEVILPSFTIISCISAVIRSGAKPVFVDVDPHNWNLMFESVRAATTNKTKCVLMVHTYGLPADALKIEEFCKTKGIFLIEDSAEAHGQQLDGRPCGSFGDITTMSFYANKHITCGEGGMVLTDNESFAKELAQMRNLGFESGRRFYHQNLWWNYRLGGMQAALGVSQLSHIKKTIKLKKKQGSYYSFLLSPFLELLKLPAQSYLGAQNHYWVYGVVLKTKGIRESVMKKLFEDGIETRPFFWPLHEQPAVTPHISAAISLPVSEDLGRNGLYLPTGSHITKRMQKNISTKLLRAIVSASAELK
jgi:perosamine synthetase